MWAWWAMQNSAVKSHDAMGMFLYVMFAGAYCSLACIDNRINANFNNLCELGEWCGIVRSGVMMQWTCFCLWCSQMHTFHSHAPTTALIRISILHVGSVSNVEQWGQESWCNGKTFICDVCRCILFIHMHQQSH